MIETQEDTIQIPIDGILDLHTFDPRDVPDLLNEYINACLKNEIYEIKIIHGKGTGMLRDRVHSILKKHLLVADFSLDPGASGWGATIVRLKMLSSCDPNL
jgi:dsDNA-specific endonuclease/ATPase MutS2